MRCLVKLAVVYAFGLSALAAPLAAEQAAAPDPARIEAAKQLMDVVGVARQLDGMIDAMTSGFAKGANADSSAAGKQASDGFAEAMKKFASYKADMLNDFAGLYAEAFTAEEMKAVTDFYRSGPGAKFVAMTPELMKKGQTIGLKYSQKIVEDMKAAAPAAKP